MFDQGPIANSDDANARLDAVLSLAPRFEPDDSFRARLLSEFDAGRRRARSKISLMLFAEAFGWRALARPVAAFSLLAGVCATGFLAGAAAAPGDRETYAALDEAFDQSFDLNVESANWAEE
jgi:hypothetical protein